ncbi:DUF2512 family protein [Ornithinibacillus sp. 179-J 7C1 HS]|uniref:DUF2512 family protein n=1 Tax=Ornithinibacillus sp. 179-J 7C1 HS TaxID=3142384 RepID=UPI0039A2E45B
MKHLEILGLKFGAVFITVLALYSVFREVSIVDIFLISMITTITSYILGDLIILRFAGNVKATIADFGLAFIILLVTSYMMIGYEVPLITLALLSSLFIACCEPFLHGYIVNQIKPNVRLDNRRLNQLQTEFAEEKDIYHLNKNK